MHLNMEKLMSSAHILLGKQIREPVSLLCIHAVTYMLLHLMLSMLSVLTS